MILVNNVSLGLDTDFENLKSAIAKALKIDQGLIKSAELYKKSVDARKKSDVHFCCSFLIESNNEKLILKKLKNATPYAERIYKLPVCSNQPKNPPVICGFGPCGMFAALTLARAGLKPIVIERGEDVDTRTKTVENFQKYGTLNPESNVQFGEGGAGTFSDGKLNTGIKDIRCRNVLKDFVLFGADKKILTDAKPHVGTDVLTAVVKNLRNEVIRLGGTVKFSTKMQSIITDNGHITGVKVICENNTEIIPTDTLILAPGHSARDVFYMLKENGVSLARKPFSVGCRIEHLQKDINRALYGKFADCPALPNADYKLAVHLDNGHGVYTFCMCPGGKVINASSEEERTAVNGMSFSARDGENSNSALLVDIAPESLPGDDVFYGIELQRSIEEKAFMPNYTVPVSTVGALLETGENKIGRIKPTVLPDYKLTDIYSVLPKEICDSIKEALPLFARKIEGFDCPDAVLTFPETRSSSPIRILREQNGCSSSVFGLFPSGEGAGYAGGIMSAAVDGIKSAELVVDFYNKTV